MIILLLNYLESPCEHLVNFNTLVFFKPVSHNHALTYSFLYARLSTRTHSGIQFFTCAPKLEFLSYLQQSYISNNLVKKISRYKNLDFC